MATKMTLTYCGIDGTGETVKLAKQNAARKIETLIEDLGRAPHGYIMTVDQWAAIVIRNAQGFGYRIIQNPTEPLKAGMLYTYGQDDSDECLRRCAEHLFQCAWSHAVADDAAWIAERQASLPTACRGAELQRSLLGWIRFQRCYRAWASLGQPDTLCHDRACRNEWPEGFGYPKFVHHA